LEEKLIFEPILCYHFNLEGETSRDPAIGWPGDGSEYCPEPKANKSVRPERPSFRIVIKRDFIDVLISKELKNEDKKNWQANLCSHLLSYVLFRG
jgi:hypothetical protein